MFKFGVFFLLCATALARPNVEIDPHIVGGTEATEKQFPFVVSLRTLNDFFFCGGGLISSKSILTAAHCVADGSKLKIGAGSVYLEKQKFYDVDKVLVHPKYNGMDNLNDIALLILKKPVSFGETIQPINFPTTENLDGKQVTALGWGRTSTSGPTSPTLMYLNKPILDNKSCSKKLALPIHEGNICLNSETNYGMCFGDSGSPLLFKGKDGKNYVAGIVSWGIPCAKGYPDVFTRVSHYTDWIKENMK